MIVTAVVLALAAPVAAGTATGSLAVAGKSVALPHAVAFNAGAKIHLLVTDKVLPPNETKGEFQLAMYQFTNKLTSIEVTLDHERKVTDVAYFWELTRKPCRECFEVTVAGGPNGPLTGTIKTTAKGEAEKLKADVAFSAPFAKASGGPKP